MCLESIKEEYESPSDVVMGGYKEFDGTDAKPLFQIDSAPVPLDQWIVAKRNTVTGVPQGKSYTSGFHVYSNDKEIPKNDKKYRRVFVRKITYLGRQSGKDVVVADEMYVPSKKNGWPPHPNFPDESLLDKLKSKLPGGNA